MKLNKIERLKVQLSPYDFRARLSQLDLHALDEAERFYLKNYGIYNIKLRPEAFMIRLRIPAGRIETQKLRFITTLAQQHALEVLITVRAQLELHGLTAENVLQVWDALYDAGISTLQTLTDNLRNIVTDPLDGLTETSVIETGPIIMQMQRRFLDKPEWMGMLPRKCNTALCGMRETPHAFMHNDICFMLAQKEGRYGFNLYLGGKNSEAAQDADIFVQPEAVPDLFKAVAQAYKHHGLRASRSKARLWHLLQEIGMVAFREKIAEYYLHALHPKGDFSVVKQSAPSEWSELRDGTHAQCIRSRFGAVDIGLLEAAVTRAEHEGLEIRLGIDQNLYLCGVRERNDVKQVTGACDITACAGSRYCALSLWDIKSETDYLPRDLIEKYHIRVGFSGCLKGCGRHMHADIGLVGLRTNLFGPVQKAARVFLGALWSGEAAAPARLLYYVVPLEHLDALVRAIIAEYIASGEADFERFSRNVLRKYREPFLTLWFLAKLYLREEIVLGESEASLYAQLREHPGFPQLQDDADYMETIRTLMHALWDSPLG